MPLNKDTKSSLAVMTIDVQFTFIWLVKYIAKLDTEFMSIFAQICLKWNKFSAELLLEIISGKNKSSKNLNYDVKGNLGTLKMNKYKI